MEKPNFDHEPPSLGEILNEPEERKVLSESSILGTQQTPLSPKVTDINQASLEADAELEQTIGRHPSNPR